MGQSRSDPRHARGWMLNREPHWVVVMPERKLIEVCGPRTSVHLVGESGSR